MTGSNEVSESLREHIVQTLALAYAQDLMRTYRELILVTIVDPERRHQQGRSWMVAFCTLLGMFHDRGVRTDERGHPLLAAAVPPHGRLSIHADALGIADDVISAIVETHDWADAAHAVEGLALHASRLAFVAGAQTPAWPLPGTDGNGFT